MQQDSEPEDNSWMCEEGDHLFPMHARWGGRCWCGKTKWRWHKVKLEQDRSYWRSLRGHFWGVYCQRGLELKLPAEGSLAEAKWFLSHLTRLAGRLK